MTLPATPIPLTRFTGNGTTTVFNPGFDVYSLSDLAVEMYDDDDALISTTAGGAGTYDYAISGTLNANNSRYQSVSVTFNTAPPTNYTVGIERQDAQAQTLDLSAGGALPPESLEQRLDRLTSFVQDLQAQINRAPSGPIGSSALMDMRGARGINAANPVNDQDLVTKAWAVNANVTVTSSNAPVVTSIVSLKAQTVGTLTDVFVTGYYAAGDGGGGQYVYNASSTAADNGGTVIAPDSGSGRWLLANQHTITSKQFGAKGNGIANDGPFIQAHIDWAETLIEQITANYDHITADVFLGSGNFLIAPGSELLIGQVYDGVRLHGASVGSTVLRYNGSGSAVSFATTVGSLSFSHLWMENLTLRGADNDTANITAGSIGVDFNRAHRHSGIRNCQIFGFETCVKTDENWIFSIMDSHIHDASVNLILSEGSCNQFYVRHCRLDDAEEDLVVLDGQGSNSRNIKFDTCVFQEGSRSAVRALDIVSIEFDSCIFENNNQADASYHAIRCLQGTDARTQGNILLTNCYHTPGGSGGISGSLFTVQLQGFRSATAINCQTGSSGIDRFFNVDSNCKSVVIENNVHILMSAGSAVSGNADDCRIREYWIELDASQNVNRTVRRDGGEYHNMTTSGSNLSTNANVTIYNLTGDGQTLTLRTEEEVDNHTILVHKNAVTGQLTIDPALTTQIALGASTDNTLILSGATGTVLLTFNGTNWVAVPYQGAWATAA